MEQEAVQTRASMLKIARKAIEARANIDGVSDYDAEHDHEGYITSILNALHHWCHEHGIDWNNELIRAEELFERDVAGLDNAALLADVQPKIADLRCPSCGHEGSYLIEVTELLLMIGEDVALDDDRGEEWGDWSFCQCDSCRFCGSVRQFREAGLKKDEPHE